MSTAVAVTGHGHVLAPADGRFTPDAQVFGPPGEQPLDAALTAMHELLRQHGHVVLLHPATLPTPHLHRLHAVRSVLESDRIALLPVALPPLGTAVLVRQLRQLSLCGFSPGVLGAAARLLTHYIYAGGVLASVAKLDSGTQIPVSLTAHAASWMPGTHFAVLAAPTPRLVRIQGGSSAEEDGLDGPPFTTEITLARGPLDSDWVSRHLARRWRAGAVREAELPEDSPRWWGTGRLTEFAAAIPDASVLYQLVASVRRDSCSWCGLELIGDRCVFCAAPATPNRPAVTQGPATTEPPAPPHAALPGSAVIASPRGLRP
ncbi:hypothetical protein [Streptomyces sp. HNM0574]|uniref:hypothetical protein n=1 Tax=Streptomyces sp. HNM0574 TaxID=2714954 RepID=UPI00146A8028|nr:hypothetical protein [Streptomyces sp. HNM0574]NLU66649.1 hypothetical protein [Streptomyces sp. HNM0574]